MFVKDARGGGYRSRRAVCPGSPQPRPRTPSVSDRLRVGWLDGFSFLGGLPREKKLLKGHLPRVVYITKYTSIRREEVHAEVVGRAVRYAQEGYGHGEEHHLFPEMGVFAPPSPLFKNV